MPPNITSSDEDWILAIACSRAGSCTAGGFDDPFESQAIVVTESNGRWHTTRSLVLPPQGNVEPRGLVNGIACTGPGNCVAVGVYYVGEPTTGSLPFVAVQSHGAWSDAHTIKMPKGAATADTFSGLTSVACPALGSCWAVGTYVDHFGHDQAMRVAESKREMGAGQPTEPAGQRRQGPEGPDPRPVLHQGRILPRRRQLLRHRRQHSGRCLLQVRRKMTPGPRLSCRGTLPPTRTRY